MSKPEPVRYRRTNGSAGKDALRRCGAQLIGLDREMARHAPHEGRSGRPPMLSGAAIQFCLPIWVLFKLPLGQTAGMVAGLPQLAGLDWPVPDHSTQCRRQSEMEPWILSGRGTCWWTARDQVPRRRRVAGPPAWRSGATRSPAGSNRRPRRLPPGTLSLIRDAQRELGEALVRQPLLQAVGFTGSLVGGRALSGLCARRPVPIPLYGKPGSMNPMFVRPVVPAAPGAQIAQGRAASLLLGAAQFCTNPGLVVAIDGPETDAFAEAFRAG